MRIHLQLYLLALWAYPFVLGYESVEMEIAERQILSSIGVCSTSTGGRCTTSTTSSTTKKSTLTQSSSKTTTSTSKPSSVDLHNLSLTTTFTQPPACTGGGVTEMALYTSQIWQNAIDPVPTATITSCFPSQFYSSVIAVASGVSLPPFEALVCPYDWETYNLNTTYIVCCPRDFGVFLPNITDTIRPGGDAICTSYVAPDVLLDITSYDSTAIATTIATAASENGTMVLANAFDGIMATSVANVTTSSSSITKTSSSVIKTTSSTITKSPSSSIKPTTSSATKPSSSSTKVSTTVSHASTSTKAT